MPNAIVRYRSTQLRSLAPPDGLAFLEDFLVDMRQRSLAEATIRSYRHDCSEFFRSVRGIPLSAIRPRDVRNYLGLLFDRGASDQTLRRTLCALRTLFRFAEVVDAVQVSPARAVQTRRVKRRLPNVLTEAEIERLIEAGATLRDRAILEFFYSTGCRIAEVAGVRVEDVDLNTRRARVIGKGDKERLVPTLAPGGRAAEGLPRKSKVRMAVPGGRATRPARESHTLIGNRLLAWTVAHGIPHRKRPIAVPNEGRPPRKYE